MSANLPPNDAAPTEMPSEGGAAETNAETARGLVKAALEALGSDEEGAFEQLVEAQDAIATLLTWHVRQTRADATVTEEGPPLTLEQLRPKYAELWASCELRPEKAGEIAWHRTKLIKNRARYEEVTARTGVPWWFVGITHALEAGFNFGGHLHNGDPLTRRTVQVPKNRPVVWNPPSDWLSSAIDALTLKGYEKATDWSVPAALFRFESYNGFGYWPRGINSPYLWSYSKHFSKGKYVADGRFDPNAGSKQCGAAAMLKALQRAGDITL